MKDPQTVNIFEQVKDPGPMPEWPGDEPVSDNFMDEAKLTWRKKRREYGDWYKKNRRYQLVLRAMAIQKRSTSTRALNDVEEAVLYMAALVLENELSADSGILGMLGF